MSGETIGTTDEDMEDVTISLSEDQIQELDNMDKMYQHYQDPTFMQNIIAGIPLSRYRVETTQYKNEFWTTFNKLKAESQTAFLHAHIMLHRFYYKNTPSENFNHVPKTIDISSVRIFLKKCLQIDLKQILVQTPDQRFQELDAEEQEKLRKFLNECNTFEDFSSKIQQSRNRYIQGSCRYVCDIDPPQQFQRKHFVILKKTIESVV